VRGWFGSSSKTSSAARGAHHLFAIHRIAAHPRDAVALLYGLLQAALERAHFPARVAQLARHFAAYAAGCTEHQCHVSVRHDLSPVRKSGLGWRHSGHRVCGTCSVRRCAPVMDRPRHQVAIRPSRDWCASLPALRWLRRDSRQQAKAVDHGKAQQGWT
jgi:hypothetical protein